MNNKVKGPNIFIVGAGKSGTTALYNFLDMHPDVYMSPIKETNYFSTDIDTEKFNDDYKRLERNKKIVLNRYVDGPMDKKIFGTYVKEYDHYIKLFKNVKNETAIGEASNSYLFSKVAAKNIKDKVPNAKIIMILRDPMTRIFSHHLACVRDGKVRGGFREELERDMQRRRKGWGISHLYVEIGMYYRQVKRYIDLYPKNNIGIYLYEDFKKNTEAVLKKILDFIGVDPDIEIDDSKRYNEAKTPKYKEFNYIITKLGIKKSALQLIPRQYRERVKSSFFTKPHERLNLKDKKYLINIYKEDVDKLSDLLNKDLSIWLK